MTNRTLIGLMSGSSLDGLDIVCVHFFEKDNILQWKVIGEPVTVNYPDRIQSSLIHVHSLDNSELEKLDDELGSFYGAAVKDYLVSKNLNVDAIASHGHTVRHHPEKGFSLQIGNGLQMAKESGLPCITQFRSEDIKQGGQGAPLAPVVEHYFFQDYKMFLNIGGIANISLHTNDKVIAYDICPANQLLNYISNQLGKAYDDKGALAKSGNAADLLFQVLSKDPFLKRTYPKSLDNNYIRDFYLSCIDEHNLTPENALATCTKFVAHWIGKEIYSLSKQHGVGDVLITGGGAFNDFLLELLKQEIGEIKIELPSEEIIKQKESILMALCGYLFLEGKPNSFASATGAKLDTVNGVLHYPETL